MRSSDIMKNKIIYDKNQTFQLFQMTYGKTTKWLFLYVDVEI